MAESPVPPAGLLQVTLNYMEVPGPMFGMKRYTLELASALQSLGVKVRLRPSQGKELRLGPLRVGGFVTKALRNFVPVRGPGLVHATDHKSNPRPGADVVTVHDLIPHEAPSLVGGGRRVRWLEAHAVRRALASGHILTDTEHVRQQLLRNFGASPAQVRTVPLGVRHDLFHPVPGPPHPSLRPGMLNVLLAMRCDLRKRGDLVVTAAARLPFVHLIHVGGQSTRDWGRTHMEAAAPDVHRLLREGRLTSLDGVDDATLPRLMACVDLVCHPSAAEGFSLPPLEALACGARVLASDIAVHREVLGGAARFVKLDAHSWESELGACWDGTGVREGLFLRRAERLRHAGRFTWDATARATLALYQEAADGRRR